MAAMTGSGDDGRPDKRLAAALVAHRSSPGAATRAEVLAALVTARVFAPVVAASTGEQVDAGTGLRAESGAEMALLGLVGSAGGRALPTFLDVPGVVAFRDGARPVARTGVEVCAAALQDGMVAVLLDPGGAAVLLQGAELAELAAGRVPVAAILPRAGSALSSRHAAVTLTAPAQVDEGLLAAAARALHDEPVSAAGCSTGRTARSWAWCLPVRCRPRSWQRWRPGCCLPCPPGWTWPWSARPDRACRCRSRAVAPEPDGGDGAERARPSGWVG